jgi:hypothetical protein
MRPLAALTSLCAAAALLTGCNSVHSAQQSASDSFHSSFRSSFKTSFLKACTDGGAPAKTCGCIEGKVEAANTDDQLMKLAAGDASKMKIGEYTRECAAGK